MEDQENFPQPKTQSFIGKPMPHYYGDQVRILFLISALLMLLGLPIFKTQIPFSIWLSITAVIILVFLAGLVNPKQVWLGFLNIATALIAFAIFEYYAITNSDNLLGAFFLLNQLLAVFFLVAFYFSAKTLRGFYLRGK